MVKDKLTLGVMSDTPQNMLPAVTTIMSKITVNKVIFRHCTSKYYGNSKMMRVTPFYKPMIIL